MVNRMTLNQRLNSLDILRGFDIFILVCIGPILKWLSINTDIVAPIIKDQFSHVEWSGFVFWDIIMPLFMFMVGTSMPFSFAKYKGGAIYWRIIKRVLLLFIFGAIVQGNLLYLGKEQIYLYSNTLQAIGVGYLISSLFILNFKIKGQIIATSLIFLLYWFLLTFCGDFTPQGNFAEEVDKLVLGRFRDLARVVNGHVVFSESYHYTWILSSLNFGVTVMLGVFVGHIMRADIEKKSKVFALLIFAVVLLISGLLLSLQMPIIKKIWTSSFTLYSGGWCVLLMAIFYYVVDYLHITTGLNWFKIYGMNAIFAYVVSSKVNFRSIPESLLFGFRPIFENYYPLFINICNYAIIFAILLLLYKTKHFLKV